MIGASGRCRIGIAPVDMSFGERGVPPERQMMIDEGTVAGRSTWTVSQAETIVADWSRERDGAQPRR